MHRGLPADSSSSVSTASSSQETETDLERLPLPTVSFTPPVEEKSPLHKLMDTFRREYSMLGPCLTTQRRRELKTCCFLPNGRLQTLVPDEADFKRCGFFHYAGGFRNCRGCQKRLVGKMLEICQRAEEEGMSETPPDDDLWDESYPLSFDRTMAAVSEEPEMQRYELILFRLIEKGDSVINYLFSRREEAVGWSEYHKFNVVYLMREKATERTRAVSFETDENDDSTITTFGDFLMNPDMLASLARHALFIADRIATNIPEGDLELYKETEKYIHSVDPIDPSLHGLR